MDSEQLNSSHGWSLLQIDRLPSYIESRAIYGRSIGAFALHVVGWEIVRLINTEIEERID